MESDKPDLNSILESARAHLEMYRRASQEELNEPTKEIILTRSKDQEMEDVSGPLFERNKDSAVGVECSRGASGKSVTSQKSSEPSKETKDSRGNSEVETEGVEGEESSNKNFDSSTMTLGDQGSFQNQAELTSQTTYTNIHELTGPVKDDILIVTGAAVEPVDAPSQVSTDIQETMSDTTSLNINTCSDMTAANDVIVKPDDSNHNQMAFMRGWKSDPCRDTRQETIVTETFPHDKTKEEAIDKGDAAQVAGAGTREGSPVRTSAKLIQEVAQRLSQLEVKGNQCTWLGSNANDEGSNPLRENEPGKNSNHNISEDSSVKTESRDEAESRGFSIFDNPSIPQNFNDNTIDNRQVDFVEHFEETGINKLDANIGKVSDRSMFEDEGFVDSKDLMDSTKIIFISDQEDEQSCKPFETEDDNSCLLEPSSAGRSLDLNSDLEAKPSLTDVHPLEQGKIRGDIGGADADINRIISLEGLECSTNDDQLVVGEVADTLQGNYSANNEQELESTDKMSDDVTSKTLTSANQEIIITVNEAPVETTSSINDSEPFTQEKNKPLAVITENAQLLSPRKHSSRSSSAETKTKTPSDKDKASDKMSSSPKTPPKIISDKSPKVDSPSAEAQTKTAANEISSTEPSFKTSSDKSSSQKTPSNETSAKTSSNRTHSSETPTKTSSNRTHSSEAPTKTSSNRTHSSETPTKTSSNRTHSSERPNKSSSNRTHSSETPTKSSSNRTNSSETPTKTSSNKTHSSETPVKTSSVESSTKTPQTKPAPTKTGSSKTPPSTPRVVKVHNKPETPPEQTGNKKQPKCMGRAIFEMFFKSISEGKSPLPPHLTAILQNAYAPEMQPQVSCVTTVPVLKESNSGTDYESAYEGSDRNINLKDSSVVSKDSTKFNVEVESPVPVGTHDPIPCKIVENPVTTASPVNKPSTLKIKVESDDPQIILNSTTSKDLKITQPPVATTPVDQIQSDHLNNDHTSSDQESSNLSVKPESPTSSSIEDYAPVSNDLQTEAPQVPTQEIKIIHVATEPEVYEVPQEIKPEVHVPLISEPEKQEVPLTIDSEEQDVPVDIEQEIPELHESIQSEEKVIQELVPDIQKSPLLSGAEIDQLDSQPLLSSIVSVKKQSSVAELETLIRQQSEIKGFDSESTSVRDGNETAAEPDIGQLISPLTEESGQSPKLMSTNNTSQSVDDASQVDNPVQLSSTPILAEKLQSLAVQTRQNASSKTSNQERNSPNEVVLEKSNVDISLVTGDDTDADVDVCKFVTRINSYNDDNSDKKFTVNIRPTEHKSFSTPLQLGSDLSVDEERPLTPYASDIQAPTPDITDYIQEPPIPIIKPPSTFGPDLRVRSPDTVDEPSVPVKSPPRPPPRPRQTVQPKKKKLNFFKKLFGVKTNKSTN